MVLIEEKIDIGFAGIIRTNVAPAVINVSSHGATKPQRWQRLFITAPAGYRE
jgi:hypothetical protein